MLPSSQRVFGRLHAFPDRSRQAGSSGSASRRLPPKFPMRRLEGFQELEHRRIDFVGAPAASSVRSWGTSPDSRKMADGERRPRPSPNTTRPDPPAEHRPERSRPACGSRTSERLCPTSGPKCGSAWALRQRRSRALIRRGTEPQAREAPRRSRRRLTS
jgi:hypothetical protein